MGEVVKDEIFSTSCNGRTQ